MFGSKVPALANTRTEEFNPQDPHEKPSMVASACDLSAGEAEPGRTHRLAGRPEQLMIQAVVREAARNSRKLAVKGPWVRMEGTRSLERDTRKGEDSAHRVYFNPPSLVCFSVKWDLS